MAVNTISTPYCTDCGLDYLREVIAIAEEVGVGPTAALDTWARERAITRAQALEQLRAESPPGHSLGQAPDMLAIACTLAELGGSYDEAG